MAESYANNQWYNLEGGVAGPNTGPGIQSLARTPKDNPEFLFPGKVRRNLSGGQDRIIQRGFIRSLLSEVPGVGESIPNRRFFFQFNPERIMRSVSVSTGLMNPLLQDPGQFSVATPGNATFSFDILLNREFEVNNATVGLIDPDVAAPAGRAEGGTADNMERAIGRVINSGTGPLQPSDVGKIGVLADLMVMDSIIGQGISDDVINALSKITSISSSWDTSDTSSGASVSGFISEQRATDAFKAIRGNSAFLVSTPVRIVFSSMFMIDGFIQGSSVNFTKFNNSMVPTMCAINVTVEAKYIGFAQKDTYLTETLRSASVAPETSTTIPESVKGPEYEVLRSAIKELSSYQIAVGGTSPGDAPITWGGSNEKASVDLNPFSDNSGYRSYWRQMAYGQYLLRAGFTEDVGTKDKGIGKLFHDANYILTFEHTPTLRVWRSFVGNEKEAASINGVTATKGLKGDGIAFSQSANGAGTVTVKRDVLLMEIIGKTARATNWDSWKKYYSYGGGGGNRTFEDTYNTIDNSVYLEAKAEGVSSDTAKNLYLSGAYADNAHNSSTPLLIEMTLTIYASITKDGKQSVVSFTHTRREFRNPGQICWNRFTIPAWQVT